MKIKVNVYNDVVSRSGEKNGKKWSFNKQDEKAEDVLSHGSYTFNLKPYVNKWGELRIEFFFI